MSEPYNDPGIALSGGIPISLAQLIAQMQQAQTSGLMDRATAVPDGSLGTTPKTPDAGINRPPATIPALMDQATAVPEGSLGTTPKTPDVTTPPALAVPSPITAPAQTPLTAPDPPAPYNPALIPQPELTRADRADLGIHAGELPGAIVNSNMTPDEINRSQKAADAWDAADQRYYSAREQKIGPLLAALVSGIGGIMAPGLGPLLASNLGISNALGTALFGAGTGAASGALRGGGLEGALLGAAGGGLGSLGGSLIGDALHGAGGFLGNLGGSGAGAATSGTLGNLAGGLGGALGGAGNTLSELVVSPLTAGLGSIGGGLGTALGSFAGAGGGSGSSGGGNSSSTFTSEFTGTTPGPSGPFAIDAALGGTPALSNPQGGGTTPTDPGTTLSPLDVVANRPPSLPELIGGGLGGVVGDLTTLHPDQPDPLQQNQKPADPKKVLQDIINQLGIGGGPGGIIAARPAGRPGITTGGPMPSPGTPGGGTPGNTPPGTGGPGSPGGLGGPGNPGGGFPPIGGLGTGFSAPPPLINGGTQGGSGVGPGGPGGLDLKGSLAPDIYPWSTGGL